jgi:predicted Rossmann fold nucleotide-binding protein DprA/Smf involved in DNA uptake
MKALDDRKMFAPLHRVHMMSPESQLVALLKRHQAGATARILADDMAAADLVVGSTSLIVKRLAELLEDLEQAGEVERIPDGRYRVVRKG